MIDYEVEKEKAKLHAEKVKLKQEIEDIKHANDRQRKPLSFSKIAVIVLFINYLVIELYSMVAMFWFNDLSALGTLIVAVLGQCATLTGYFIKSGKENTAGGIVFETTMKELELDNNSVEEDDGAVG